MRAKYHKPQEYGKPERRYIDGPYSTVEQVTFRHPLRGHAPCGDWYVLFLEDGTTAEGKGFEEADRAKWLHGQIAHGKVTAIPVEVPSDA